MADLTYALHQLNDALSDYEEAHEYYVGMADEVFVSSKISLALNGTAEAFRINYARIPIRERLSRLEINSVTGDTDEISDLIDLIWEENGLGLEAHDVHETAMELGDCYVVLWPNDDETMVNIFSNSPATTRLFYSTENPRVKAFAVKRWINDDGYVRVDLMYPDRIEKYISLSDTGSRSNEIDFTEYVDEEGDSWPYENPYGEVPVVHFRTARPYGRPEHADAFGPQAMLNKLIVTQMATVEMQGWPARFILEDPAVAKSGSPADEFFDAPGGVGVYDDDDDESQAVGPGDATWLRGVKDVLQLEAADSKNFLEPMQAYIQSMAAVTDTPIHLFETGNAPSGESLRVREAPLVKRVQALQLVFGASWREVFRLSLKMLGVTSAVAVSWKPAATYDDREQWEAAKAQIEAGVSVSQALAERGYTQQQIEEFGPLLRPDADPAKLAAAVTLGLITEEEARAALGFGPRG